MSKLELLDPKFKPAFDGNGLACQLAKKLQAAHPILEAYLFGSAAIGKNTSDSDIDLLIVIADDANETEYQKTVGSGFFSDIAVDWIFKKHSEFEQRKDLGGACFIAYHQGVKLKI